jgi:hypothetical protein
MNHYSEKEREWKNESTCLFYLFVRSALPSRTVIVLYDKEGKQ